MFNCFIEIPNCQHVIQTAIIVKTEPVTLMPAIAPGDNPLLESEEGLLPLLDAGVLGALVPVLPPLLVVVRATELAVWLLVDTDVAVVWMGLF